MNRRGLVLIVSLTAHVWAGTPSLESCPGVLFLSASELNATTTSNDMLPGQCIGEPRHLKWVNVNDFGLNCWDAELPYGVVGTPGGDFAGKRFAQLIDADVSLTMMPVWLYLSYVLALLCLQCPFYFHHTEYTTVQPHARVHHSVIIAE